MPLSLVTRPSGSSALIIPIRNFYDLVLFFLEEKIFFLTLLQVKDLSSLLISSFIVPTEGDHTEVALEGLEGNNGNILRDVFLSEVFLETSGRDFLNITSGDGVEVIDGVNTELNDSTSGNVEISGGWSPRISGENVNSHGFAAGFNKLLEDVIEYPLEALKKKKKL